MYHCIQFTWHSVLLTHREESESISGFMLQMALPFGLYPISSKRPWISIHAFAGILFFLRSRQVRIIFHVMSGVRLFGGENITARTKRVLAVSRPAPKRDLVLLCFGWVGGWVRGRLVMIYYIDTRLVCETHNATRQRKVEIYLWYIKNSGWFSRVENRWTRWVICISLYVNLSVIRQIIGLFKCESLLIFCKKIKQ